MKVLRIAASPFRLGVLLAFSVAIAAHTAGAAELIRVPFTQNQWTAVHPLPGDPKTDAAFMQHEGFPQGVLALKAGELALNGFRFRDGTIEFDIKPTGADIPGIRFRQKDAGNAEEFYVRSFPDCRASEDCIQYAPVIHGFMLWDAYPQYQTVAPVLEGWNHVKLVVSGRRMNVFINRSATPTLAVGELQADAAEGGIEVRGPAYFANLTLTPDAIESLPGRAAPDPAAADRGIVRQWLLSPLVPFHIGEHPSYAQAPADARLWKSMTADDAGLVNLNRQYDAGSEPPELVWLRANIVSARAGNKRVSLGWLGQVWVFVNGKPVTEGKNFYYPESERRNDGRLSFDNGSFEVPLQKGMNEITMALYSTVHEDSRTRTRYGWGCEMRFHNMTGLRFAASGQAAAR